MPQQFDDREPLKKGRKNILKDSEELQVSVPLRDQIPKKLMAKLNDMEMGRTIADNWQLGNSHRADWVQRQQEYLSDWDEHLVPKSDGEAFEGGSNLHIPMPMTVCKTVHARFMQALLSGDPTVRPRNEASVASSQMVQDLLSYTLNEWANWRRGITGVIDSWLWDIITTGCGILKLRWEKQFQRYVDVVQKARQGTPRFIVDALGVERAVASIEQYEEEETVTRLVFEGPVFQDVRVEDLLIVGGEGDPQLADSVTESVKLTASELWSLVDQGIFDKAAVEEAIKQGHTEHDSHGQEVKDARAINAGHSKAKDPAALKRYEILEDYRRAPIDGSGINSEIVTWVDVKSQKILRATYLHRISKSGERPYYKADWHKRPGQVYGTGLVEMLHPLSVEMDAIHNQRIDSGTISNMPIGFYRSTSSIDPETIDLVPGALIPVDDPTSDIVFPQMGNRTSFGLQEEAALQTLVERLSSVNDLTTGVLTGAQGATRTATGVRGLLGEQNANLDVHLRRINRAWQAALQGLLHLLQQRLPPGMEYRVTAETGDYYFQRVQSREQITGDFEFELDPNSSNTNRAIQEQTATELLQLVLNPLLIQTQNVNVGSIYEALKMWAKAKRIQDFGRFFPKPPSHRVQLAPGEEAFRVLQGIQVPVTPEADHEGFVALAEELLGNDQLMGQFPFEAARALQAQMMQHVQMQQALQQAQQQAANIAQQQQNAATSQNQAPVGLNPLQGAGGG